MGIFKKAETVKGWVSTPKDNEWKSLLGDKDYIIQKVATHPFTVVIIVSETEEKLQNVIAEYMKWYHPYGYGTSVDKKWTTEEGLFAAKISRANSAD